VAKLPTERDKLEAELIRIDRTLALDRKKLNQIQVSMDNLIAYRMTIESQLFALKAKK
jgi:2C-methyl-D-erythritol 2,4-cyclodiphosphate synthase